MIPRVTLSEEAITSPRWLALTIVESPLHPGRELEITQREALRKAMPAHSFASPAAAAARSNPLMMRIVRQPQLAPRLRRSVG